MSRRHEAQRRGRWAERLAAWRLRFAGYHVIDCNYRSPVGEIDLIVCRGRTLVFVEIKARGSLDEAAEAIRANQQRRIHNAAELFLAGHPQFAGHTLRFDAVLLAPGRFPRHLPDAWRDSASWTR